MTYESECDAVLRWLNATDAIAREHFRAGISFEDKADGTPVTIADTEIERALREAIAADFPSDAVVGEEEGSAGDGPRRWIVDPIDGTRSFRRGIPVFATLVALEDDGALVLGAVSAPALGARWWATRGGGAFRDGRPIRVSAVADLAHAEIASGGAGSLRRAGLLDRFADLADRAERHRGFADFWGHMLVAEGAIEAMVDPSVSVWDLAAPKAIVEEAGGRMTSIAGEDRIDAGSALTTNGVLHAACLAALTG